MTTKFNLLFENIMNYLNNSLVDYQLFDTLINRNIANELKISQEELFKQYGKINAFIANSDEIMSVIYHGWHDEKSKQEAKQLNNKIVIINLAETQIPEDDYLFLQHDSNLAENVLNDLHNNGFYEIQQVYIQ